MKAAQALGLTRIGIYALRETSGPIIAKQGFDQHGAVEQWTQSF